MPSVIALKRAVRARDGMRCIECGKTNEQHEAETGKQLEVHRVNPGSPYTIDGCVTLCRTCHGPQPRSPYVRTPPKNTDPKATLYVEIPEDLKQEIDALAARHMRKITAEVILALRRHVEAEKARDAREAKGDAE